jgi:hypothetical protein
VSTEKNPSRFQDSITLAEQGKSLLLRQMFYHFRTDDIVESPLFKTQGRNGHHSELGSRAVLGSKRDCFVVIIHSHILISFEKSGRITVPTT